MRILLVHNYYQKRGGEGVVFESERQLLRQNGHEVFEYLEDNQHIQQTNKLVAAIETIWSRPAKQALTALLRDTRPDVVHVHNTFMRLSPSVYYACQEAQVPVIQTLHNYRLLCPAGTFFRHGRLCEACTSTPVPIPAVLHACYRQSRLQSAVVASMLAFHWARQSWQAQVDAYITLTEFARQKFIQNGLPAERLFVKPNFIVSDPGERRERGAYALFVGYLGEHKGIRTLLEAWRELSDVPLDLSLKVIGDGPLFNEAKAYIEQHGLTQVALLGRCPRQEVFSIMKKAAFLLFPSVWYEGFPMTIVEAFACGVPVIASRLGAMTELIEDQRTGLHFTPHDADDLANKVQWALTHPDQMDRMGKEGRQAYENHYTAEQNYRQLLTIYQEAQARHAHKRGAS